jgi:large subunit ribosomal protein L1
MAKKTAPPTADAAEAAAPAVPEAVAAPPKAAVPAPGAASSPPATTIGTKRRPGRGPRRGKKLRNHLKNQLQKLEKEPAAPIKKAVQLLKSMKRVKFDETVEVHMALGIDTTQSDQLVRGAISLPHGIGKSVRVLVFCQGDNVAKAKAAGADFAGADDLIAKVQSENFLDFDVALATQDMMGKVSRLGKVLGPRGLMPTPKAGTVIAAGGDISVSVNEFKAGKVEYRADKGGNIHAGVGKMSFDEDKLVENVHAFVEQIKHVKPASVKGHYIKSVTLSATMSPGILLQV